MIGVMHPRSEQRLTRRAVLGSAGVAVLAVLTGCSPFGSEPPVVTVTEDAAPPPAPILALVFKTRLHVANLEAAVAADARDADVLGMLLSDRRAHLDALIAENQRLGGAPVPTTDPEQPGELPDLGDDPDEILAVIRGDAAEAQGLFTDAMIEAPAGQAELFASIAACAATHRAVLV